MANPVGKLGFKLVSIAVGIPVGILARKAVGKAWLAARPNDPPRTLDDGEVSWGDALGWAALSAAGVAAAELVTIKGAGAAWRLLTGSPPPAPKKSAKDAKAKIADGKGSAQDARALSAAT
jgi:hypothetical protein